jgi:hypothetical protein
MLRAKDITRQFAREGAKKRLAELDAERVILLQILGGHDLPSPKPLKKKRTQSAKHWTRTPQGRAKMSRLMKAKYAAGWKAQMRRGHAGPQPTAEQQLTSALPETDQSTH